MGLLPNALSGINFQISVNLDEMAFGDRPPEGLTLIIAQTTIYFIFHSIILTFTFYLLT